MYSRYFSSGQKLQIQSLRKDTLPARREAVNALFSSYELGFFDIALPREWPADADPPFADGPLEIISERYGLWLKSTASFHSQPSEKSVRLRMHNDLRIFRHRPKTRIDARVGLCYSARHGSPATLHRQWRQQVDKLTSTATALTAPNFSRSQVNLSASGIRMQFQSSPQKSGLCLLMMALDEVSEPICTLGEIIWTAPAPQGQATMAGMQFLNLLEKDQHRIEQFVKSNRLRAENDLS